MDKAAYLLRFDDLCPTMNWRVWDAIEETLLARSIKPILAIVPDNRDPKLMVNPPSASFWQRARAWQANGWQIALHGYQHLYVSNNAGVVGTRKKSEFAGVPRAQQAEKLRKGIEIFRDEGIQPTVWVAPGHTFDETTISLLPEFGLNIISDGFTRYPFRSGDITWVPQQLWEFRKAPRGVWTICFHHNDWTEGQLQNFRTQLAAYGPALSTLQEVLSFTEYSFDAMRLLYRQPTCADVMIRAQLRLHQLTSS